MNFRDIYVFLGPPGAGKGSLSQKCITDLKWRQLSTGMLCRKHIAEDTEIGRQIDFAIKSGKLIEDTLIISMVEQWLNENQGAQSIILDGFPRTVAQAKALNAFLDADGSFKLNVVQLSISDAAIFDRIAGRLVCQNSSCQMVFSDKSGSTQAPKKTMVCDECGGQLQRRSDDAKDSITERLKVYKQHASALTDYYKAIGQKIYDINVEKSLDEVFQEFLKETKQSV